MKYINNWDERKQRYNDTWAKENHDRPLVLVSAADSSDLFDLRAQVREELVEWISSQATDALPVTRTLAEGAAPPPAQA